MGDEEMKEMEVWRYGGMEVWRIGFIGGIKARFFLSRFSKSRAPERKSISQKVNKGNKVYMGSLFLNARRYPTTNYELSSSCLISQNLVSQNLNGV